MTLLGNRHALARPLASTDGNVTKGTVGLAAAREVTKLQYLSLHYRQYSLEGVLEHGGYREVSYLSLIHI